MIVQRVLAALTAVFLVSAVAIATFGARAMTLEVALRKLNRGMADTAFSWAEQTLGPWAWTRLIQPLMVRPAWLPLVCLGLITLGLFVSVSYRSKQGPSRHKKR